MELLSNLPLETFGVTLEGGGPWGFTLQGGADFRSPLKIGKVTPGGKAQSNGLVGGDIILSINGISTSTMKHHEAQRLIAASKTTLELTCSKSVAASPKSSTQFRTFDYPSPRSTTPVQDGEGKASTLGRHARQSSLDLNTFRSRAWSDAGKKAVIGERIAGIRVPAPPPSVKGKAPLIQPEKSRYVAGIKVPAPPPSVKPKPVRSHSKEKIQVALNDNTPKDETLGMNSSSSTPAVLDSTATISDTLVKKEQSSFESSERDTSSEIIDMLTAIQNDFTPTTPESQTSSSDFKDISSEKDHIEAEYHSSTSGYKSGIASSSEEDILSTSAGSGSDWYKSMFQSMKKGVEEQLPNKKHVTDRSPTPARKAVFTSKPKEDETALSVASSSASNRRSSESSLPSPPAGTKPMTRTNSSGVVDAVNSLTSGVVYRKNMQNFKHSRNYWKEIERQASQERIELAAAAARRNSFHRTSSTSSTGRVASPDITETANGPVFNESLSEFKEPAASVEEKVIKKSPSPASSPTTEQPKTPPTSYSPRAADSPPLRSSSPLGRQTPPLERLTSPLGTQAQPETLPQPTSPQTPPLNPVTPPSKSPQTPPLNPVTPPPKSPQTPPPKSPQTPPPKSPQTPPPKSPQTPPLNPVTPPSKSPQTPPLNPVTPPPKSPQTPPPKSPQTPPLNPVTPPLKLPQTPPLKPATPPLILPTSPLKPPTPPLNPQTPPADVPNFDETMSKLHPLLKDSVDGGVEERESSDLPPQQDVFTRIDPNKLNTALGNATIIGKMEQEGVSGIALQSAALAVGQANNSQEEKPVPQKKRSKVAKPPPAEKAKALYDFEAAGPKEMSFKKGAIITLTEQVDSNWLKGTLDTQTGIFPVNFVKLLTQDDILLLNSQVDPVEPPPLNLLAKAKYNFTAKSSKELSFNKNDIITLVKQIDDNWYSGCLGEEKGIVPVTYVQIFDVKEDD